MFLLIVAFLYTAINTFNLAERFKALVQTILLKNSASQATLNELHAKKTKITKEKLSISPQDQYAKWTKLNRQLDSVEVEIKAQLDKIATDSSSWNVYLKGIDGALTLPFMYLRFRRYKVVNDAVFLWLPTTAQYWLSAKQGGIGINLWLTCASTVLYHLKSIYGVLTEEKLTKPTLVEKVQPVD